MDLAAGQPPSSRIEPCPALILRTSITGQSCMGLFRPVSRKVLCPACAATDEAAKKARCAPPVRHRPPFIP